MYLHFIFCTPNFTYQVVRKPQSKISVDTLLLFSSPQRYRLSYGTGLIKIRMSGLVSSLLCDTGFLMFYNFLLKQGAYYRKTPLHYTTLCIDVAFIYDFKDKLMKFCDLFHWPILYLICKE